MRKKNEVPEWKLQRRILTETSIVYPFLQQCAEMDALPIEKRKDALAFARAMTALEGLPAKEETEKNLQLWARGEKIRGLLYKVLESLSYFGRRNGIE